MPSIRLGLAAALMKISQFETAGVLLEPLANAAHGGQAIEIAQTLLERARAGQAPLDPDAIDAASEADETAPPEPPPTDPATPSVPAPETPPA